MASNSVEVITLLSSDEDSNPKVESAQSEVKPRKVTARKSIHSSSPIATAVKEEPPAKVSKPSTDKMPSTTSNTQTKSANSLEPKEGPVSHKKTARKSFQNSGNPSAPKVVSTMTNSSRPQGASTSSKNETLTVSQKHAQSNSAIVNAVKFPGLTITPLSSTNAVVKNVGVLQTARKSCNSGQLTKGTGVLGKHFKPSATSTPKLPIQENKKINSVITNAKRASSPLIPESCNPIKPLAAGITLVPAPLTTSVSTNKVPAMMSISQISKILPGVSIHPLNDKGHPLNEKGAYSKITSTKSGNSPKTSKGDVPTSLLDSLGKTGVTVTNTTKNAKSKNLLKICVETFFDKEKKSSQTVNLVSAGITITNSLNNVNKSTCRSKTSTDKGSQRQEAVKQNYVVGSIASNSGVSITPVGRTKLDKPAKLLNENKVTHTKINNRKNVTSAVVSKTSSESIALKTTKNIEVSKISKDSTKEAIASIKKTQLNQIIDSLIKLKSNNEFTVLPVKERATSTINISPQRVHSENSDATPIKEVSSQSGKDTSKKSTLMVTNPNKKAKLDPEPRLNGIHSNGATAEENMKRISALKESLKKITGKTSKNIVTGNDRLESSNSQSKGLGKDATMRPGFPGDSAGKNNGCQSESLAHQSSNSESSQSGAGKSVNSAKGFPSERPFKQVTSPKLSLKKRKAAEEARVLQKKSTQAIPLPYDTLEPAAKKAKLNSSEQNVKAIPLPYIPRKPSELNSTDQNARALPLPQSNVPPNLTSNASSDPNTKTTPSPDIARKPSELNSADQNATTFPLPQINVPPNLSSNAQQKDTRIWDSTDSNTERFQKLLEFSKSFMSATPEEKCTIVKNFHKLLDKADTSYIDSADFASLMDNTLQKIKDSKNTFIHLQTIKTELKAYKKRKGTPAPVKPRRQSSSSEQSETLTLKLGTSPSEPSKEVPAPTLGDHLASALHSIASNLKHKESQNSNNDTSYPFLSVPSTSKQADIIENLRLSMPVSNGIKTPCELKDAFSTLKHADIMEELRSSLPMACEEPSSSGVVDKAADPLTPSGNASDVVGVEGNAAEKEALLENLGLQCLKQQTDHQSEAEIANGSHKGSSLPTVSLKEHVDQPKTLDGNNSKIGRRVKVLEDLLEKLDKKIKKLQSKELSLDDLDDEDSTYILEDRYKKKFHKAWVTLCKLKKRNLHLGWEMEKKFTYQGSRHGAFNKAIEKLINKRKSAEKFPNFVEVHNLLKKVNEDANLALGSYEVENAAREAFENVGIELKKRRQQDNEKDFGCYLTDDFHLQSDPAEQDEELNKKLSSSVVEGERKIKEMIDKYAIQQREDPSDEAVEGSDCEEPGGNEDGVEEAMDCDELPTNDRPEAEAIGCEEPIREDNLEDLSVGLEVGLNSEEFPDLPDTAPATPVTDEAPENDLEVLPPIARPSSTDVIELGDTSSNASTDPGPEVMSTVPTFVTDSESRIFISDVIEIAEDSSPELPSLTELL